MRAAARDPGRYPTAAQILKESDGSALSVPFAAPDPGLAEVCAVSCHASWLAAWPDMLLPALCSREPELL
jgi:hypothetical protein